MHLLPANGCKYSALSKRLLRAVVKLHTESNTEKQLITGNFPTETIHAKINKHSACLWIRTYAIVHEFLKDNSDKKASQMRTHCFFYAKFDGVIGITVRESSESQFRLMQLLQMIHMAGL